jgi:hypothetical protein
LGEAARICPVAFPPNDFLDYFLQNNCGPTRQTQVGARPHPSDASGSPSGRLPLVQVGRAPSNDNWALRAYGPLVID